MSECLVECWRKRVESGKITVAAKSGRKIKSISYDNGANKYWSHSIYDNGASKATLSIPAKIGSGGYVSVNFTNTKTGGTFHTQMAMR